jgi:hypothetical protein
MSIVLTQLRQSSSKKETVQIKAAEADEFMVFCPKCGTLETVWFVENMLVPTPKFSQEDTRVYHDCGSDTSCHLYRTF